MDYAVSKKKSLFEAGYNLSGPEVLSACPPDTYFGSIGNG
jgi:hypothetical protein